MSEHDQPAAPESPPSTAAVAGMPPGAERVFVRLTIWQTVIGLAGVFIGVVALYAALTESEAVRRQTAAAVWPIVQFRTLDSGGSEAPRFAAQLVNAGVGPARIRAMRLVIDGEVMTDWNRVVARVGDGEDRETSRNYTVNRVLRPGEDVEIFATEDPVIVEGMLGAIADPDSRLELCYCSIFDECWSVDSRRTQDVPEPVATCPDYGTEAFRG